MWALTLGLALLAVALGAMMALTLERKLSHFAAKTHASGISGAEVAAALARSQGLVGLHLQRGEAPSRARFQAQQACLQLPPEIHDGRHLTALGLAAASLAQALYARDHPRLWRWLAALERWQSWGGRLGLPLLAVGALSATALPTLLGLLAYLGAVLGSLATLPLQVAIARRAAEVVAGMHLLRDQAEAEAMQTILVAAALSPLVASLSLGRYPRLRPPS